MIEITTDSDEQVAEKRIEVFSIDGTVYTMPEHVSPSIALRLLDQVAEHGEMLATRWVLREVMGTVAYDALKNCESITESQMRAVLAVVQKHVLGAMESTTGN